MKRLIILTLALVLMLSACQTVEVNGGLHYIEGRFLMADNGSAMIIYTGGAISLDANKGVSFDELTDGDMIKVGIYYVLESYPGQATAYSLEKLSDGERSDIDPKELLQLAELGWVKE